MLAGLSQCWIFKTPPDFCASATSPCDSTARTAPAAAATDSFRPIMPFPPSPASLIEPHVFHAQPVVDRVDRHRVPLHIGAPAGTRTAVVKNRPSHVLRQLLLDLPHHFLALVLVELHRLLIDHLVELGIAIAVVIAFGAAGVILVQGLVRIIEPVADQIETDREILL